MAEINVFSTQKSAEFVAWLTNAIVYKDENGKFRIAKKEELNKLIGERYAKNDFIGANELLESAKRTIEFTDKDMAEVVSKSVRVSSATFIRLVEFAYKNKCTLADSVRIALSGWMREGLKRFEGMEGVDIEKIKKIKEKFEKLNEVGISEGNTEGNTYSLYIAWKQNEKELKKMREYNFKLLGISIYKYLKNKKIPEENIKRIVSGCLGSFVREYLDVHEYLDETPSIPSEIYLQYQNDSMYLKFLFGVKDFIIHNLVVDYDVDENDFPNDFPYVDDYKRIFEKEEIDIIKKIAYKKHEKSDEPIYFTIDIVDKKDEYYSEEVILNYNQLILNDKILYDNSDNLYFNSILLDNKNRETLISEILKEKFYKNETIPNISQLQSEIHTAISNNDLEKASELSKILVNYEVYRGITEECIYILLSTPKNSQVPSFTVPKILLRLIETLQEDKKLGDIIGEEIKKVQKEDDKKQKEIGDDKHENTK